MDTTVTSLPSLPALLDALPALGVYLYDLDGNVILANRMANDMWRYTPASIIGKNFNTLTAPTAISNGSAERFRQGLRGEAVDPWIISYEVAEPGKPLYTITVEARQVPVYGPDGALSHLCRLYEEVSLRLRREARLDEQAHALASAVLLQEELQQTIYQLSTPLIPIYDGILIMPLVGNIDSGRAALVLETLLEGIQEHHASQVLLDITGLPIVDTAVAGYLLQATSAAALLGAEVILVGTRPEVAQTIVQLGIDLSQLATRSDLQAGLAYALARRGLTITPRARV